MVIGVYTNIQPKIKINGLLSDPFTLMIFYIVTAELLASFIDANEKIKEIQIGDHDNNIVNFAEDTTMFLRGSTCLGRIQVIKKP